MSTEDFRWFSRKNYDRLLSAAELYDQLIFRQAIARWVCRQFDEFDPCVASTDGPNGEHRGRVARELLEKIKRNGLLSFSYLDDEQRSILAPGLSLHSSAVRTAKHDDLIDVVATVDQPVHRAILEREIASRWEGKIVPFRRWDENEQWLNSIVEPVGLERTVLVAVDLQLNDTILREDFERWLRENRMKETTSASGRYPVTEARKTRTFSVAELHKQKVLPCMDLLLAACVAQRKLSTADLAKLLWSTPGRADSVQKITKPRADSLLRYGQEGIQIMQELATLASRETRPANSES